MSDVGVLESRASARSRRARGLGLAAICCGFLMITVDATIVNVALGPIVADLGGSLAAAQWVVSAYTLCFASFMLSAGAWSDRIGSRRAFLIGLAIFGIGSAACSAAPTMGALIAARGVQGLGAALLMPCTLALITHDFAAGDERRRALAAWGGVSALGLAAGPVLGGVLADSVGWRAIFLVNLPVAAAAAVATRLYLVETPRHRHALDPPGQLLVVLTLGCLSGGFILAGSAGWTATATIGLLVLGSSGAVGFWRAQRRAPEPMVPPDLLRRRRFSLVVAVASLYNFAVYGGLFCLSLYFHLQLGLDPLETGLALLPLTATIGCLAFASGRLIGSLGEWWAMLIGLVGAGLGAVLLATVGSGSTAAAIAASLPLGAAALTMQAMTALAMEEAPPNRIGLASGVQNTARQAGGALGVALLGTLLSPDGELSLTLPMAGAAAAYLAASGLTLVAWRRTAADPPPG